MNAIAEMAYKTDLLKPDVHGRLVQNLTSIARVANVPQNMVWTPLATYCSKEEVEFVKGLRKHASTGTFGLVYTGDSADVGIRMQAIAGACLRNFIDARYMILQDVLAALQSGDSMDASVLLIPNFFLRKKEGGSIPNWQVSMLMGMLLNRQVDGLQTFVYVQDMKDMSMEYGPLFTQHLESCFTLLHV